MRVLLFNFIGLGHIYPTRPIIQELIKRDNHITAYGLDIHRDVIQASGANFRPYPIAIQTPTSAMNLAANVTTWVLELLPEILKYVDQEQPDIIMTDSMNPLGWYVARISKLPLIVLTTHYVANATITDALGIVEFMKLGATDDYDNELALFLSAADSIRTNFDIEPLTPRDTFQVPGDLILVTTSTALQPHSELLDDSFKFVGPMIESRTDDPNFPFDWIENNISIYVSLGTQANNSEFFQICVDAFRDASYHVLVSSGGKDIGLNNLAPNILFKKFVPQVEVLKHTDVFLTHGGWNSVNEALYHDVPLVVYPQGKDQFTNAKIVSQLGAGIVLSQPSIENLRESIDQILQNPKYRKQAKQIGQTLRDTGGAVRAATEILSFAKDS